VVPSLTRGLVCLLYMLLALASTVFLGAESLGSRDHILLSVSRLPFSSTPTTRMVTVEVFDPASTRMYYYCPAEYVIQPLCKDLTENSLYCCVRVCWGSHVIATQPAHWRTGCFLATVAARTQREHRSYCCVIV
jgi:hypothetical protein